MKKFAMRRDCVSGSCMENNQRLEFCGRQLYWQGGRGGANFLATIVFSIPSELALSPGLREIAISSYNMLPLGEQ